MATHSSVLAWRIPGTEEPGGLPSMGSHRVGHDWSDLAAAVLLGAEKALAPHSVLLPGKSHGCRSLVGCSPWGREQLSHFPFSLSYIGEGNGNPLQCSCLDNPRDGGAWWAAVCGVAQSRTQLKRLSSSSSSIVMWEKLLTEWWVLYDSISVIKIPLPAKKRKRKEKN